MIDIALIRESPDEIAAALRKRMLQVDFTELLTWDERRRSAVGESESLKAERNRVSRHIGTLKRADKDTTAEVREMKTVAAQVKALDGEIKELEGRIHEFLSGLPNTPQADVPAGGKENNETLRHWGEKPAFAFDARHHVAMAESLRMVDYRRGAKISGNGFWIYTADGARLEWALLNFFVEEHLRDGYEFILPPHILLHECGYVAGQFPKFGDDVLMLEADTKQARRTFLIPTSETALTSYHRGEILSEDQLPKKYCAYTPCYRREAGSYRSEERGMIRGHQFNKVEMFQLTTPERSAAAFEELLGKAEDLVQKLGLHYRVSKLAAADCAAAMSKTVDIEVWIPSMSTYKEVSSVSNARDYQARRGDIRLRRTADRRTEYVHTLNASGLATSRLIPAIVEQFQTAQGTVVVPESLRKWTGKDEIIPQECPPP